MATYNELSERAATLHDSLIEARDVLSVLEKAGDADMARSQKRVIEAIEAEREHLGREMAAIAQEAMS